MAAVFVVLLSTMVLAYALVALATVQIWRLAPHREGDDDEWPERLVDEGGARTRRHRCSEAAHRSPVRSSSRAHCSHRRRRNQ